MEKCEWLKRLQQEYGIISPAQLSTEITETPFIEEKKELIINGIPSRFTEEQRKIIQIAQMTLFDTLRGIVHRENGSHTAPSFGEQTVLQMKRKFEILPHIPPTFREALLAGLFISIQSHNAYYPNLVRALEYEFNHAGDLGTARALLNSSTFLADAISGELTEENKNDFRQDLHRRSCFVKEYSTKQTICLGTHLALEMYKQAKTAALLLAQDNEVTGRYDSNAEQQPTSPLLFTATFRSLFNNS